jgi:hypothetical protein
MGLIDVRRFWVTTRVGGSGELVVSDVRLAEEDEWEINLAQVIEVNALCVPASRPLTYQVMDNELRLLASFLTDTPGAPISVRHLEFKASAGHVKRFVTESFGLGMLTAAVERYYRWLRDSDLANFDVLPSKYIDEYPASGVRPDLLFDFTSQGNEKRLAGEARGRSERRPKSPNRDQRERLDQIVAWSGRNYFHPVTMTWAYSGAQKVQVDFFDIQDSEEMHEATEDGRRKRDVLTTSSAPADITTVRFLRQRALGRIAAIANELYETAPQPVPERARQIFGRNVRGEWTTADLVAPSNLRLFLGVLSQPLDQRQPGAPRRARGASPQAWDADPIQIAVTQRILVVVARDSAQEPDWEEVTRRIEQPGQ